MKTYIITLFFVCLLFITCKNKSVKSNKTSIEDKLISNNSTADDTIAKALDTTIFLRGLTKSNYSGLNLTSSYAKKIFYSYFKSKGYLTSDNLQNMEKLKDSDSDKLIVDYDTLFITDINENKNRDAIITYWLTPPYTSGNCWQPHKAIIVDNENGYQLINEDFIPDNFSIDSVVTREHKAIIFGYEYDCVNHKAIRNFRVNLRFDKSFNTSNSMSK